MLRRASLQHASWSLLLDAATSQDYVELVRSTSRFTFTVLAKTSSKYINVVLSGGTWNLELRKYIYGPFGN